MLALAFMKNQDNVIIPSEPKGEFKEDWALAYFKAVENNGRREMKSEHYIAKTNKGRTQDKLKHEVNLVGSENETEAVRYTYTIAEDIAFYVANSAEEVLEHEEVKDLVAEFLALEEEILIDENIWLSSLLQELIELGQRGTSTKRLERVKETVYHLNVYELFEEVITTPNALKMIFNAQQAC